MNADVPLSSVHVKADPLGPVLAASTVEDDNSAELEEVALWNVFVGGGVDAATNVSVTVTVELKVEESSVTVSVKTMVLVHVLKLDVGSTKVEETPVKVSDPAVGVHQFPVQL